MKSLLALIVLLPLTSFAQENRDPIARYLIAPEVVMSQSSQLGLSEKQRAAIKAEIQKTQAKVLDVQWDLQEETGKMEQLLQQSPVDEAKVLETADRIMSFEREIKRAHLAMLVRIRNLLTAEQVAKLRK